MFHNNINKPAITVFFATDISKNYFCRDFFLRKKTVFTGHWQKLANPDLRPGCLELFLCVS